VAWQRKHAMAANQKPLFLTISRGFSLVFFLAQLLLWFTCQAHTLKLAKLKLFFETCRVMLALRV
jgi:hypothetical protein